MKPQISSVVVGNTLKISASCPRVLGINEPSCSVGLDIGAPASTAVTVKSTSGDTRISGLSGDLSLRTTSGSIELEGVSGRLAAQLTSGKLTARRVSSAEVQAHTTSGGWTCGSPHRRTAWRSPPPRARSARCCRMGSTYRVNVHGPADVDPALNDTNSTRSITASVSSGHSTLGYTPNG